MNYVIKIIITIVIIITMKIIIVVINVKWANFQLVCGTVTNTTGVYVKILGICGTL